jgi:hypothetical protein
MSAPALTVRRFTTTAHLPDDRLEEGGRVAAIARGVAARRLGRALGDAGLPPGIWCIRRLEVTVRFDLERPDAALEAAWAAAVVGAVRHALATGSDGVVRYDRERDALVAMVADVAVGRFERAWVWARLGLAGACGPPAWQAPGAVVAVLARRPEQALGVVVEAARRVGVAAMHRALGPAGWAEVAAIARAAVGGRPRPRESPPPPAGPRPPASVATLAAELVAGSSLAGLVRTARLRPDWVTIDAWALLVTAEADASVPRRHAAAAVEAAVAELLAVAFDVAPPPSPTAPAGGDTDDYRPAGPAAAPQAGGRRAPATPAVAADPPVRPVAPGPVPPPAPGTPAPRGPAAGPAPAGEADPDRGGRAVGPEPAGTGAEPAAAAGHPTDWAGLLFLLATAAAAGVPEALTSDPVLEARTLPWALTGVALALLPVAAADPAVAAFAGLDPEARSAWATGRPATEAELRQLRVVAARWAAVTAEALDRTGTDHGVAVVAVARRRGRIDHSPGWVDVHLELDKVDIDVRRAGLDLDPGWVPWLGTVVRFVYG